ncbi:MAG: helix-turn-helix domain-containing protein [Alphaproteobacteria bacterium]
MAESGATTGPESSGANTAALEFGGTLREIRQGQNLELHDIAKALRIRENYLKGIEDGQFEKLPGPAYANGFVRAYADYLGLEVDEVMRRYKLAAFNSLSKPSIAPLPITAEARLPTGLVLLVAALLAAGTYGVWYYLTVRGQSSKEVISALPETISDFAALTKKPNKKTMDPVEKIAPKTLEKLENQLSIPKKALSPNLAITPEKFTTTILPSKTHPNLQLKVKDPSLKKLEVKRLAATTQSQNVKSEKKVISKLLKPKSRIVLRANAASWVELREAGGKRLISKILREGDSYQVPLQAGIKFTTGNAGGVDILIDGKIIASLGPVGAVRRDILLDPDILLARSPGQR